MRAPNPRRRCLACQGRVLRAFTLGSPVSPYGGVGWLRGRDPAARSGLCASPACRNAHSGTCFRTTRCGGISRGCSTVGVRARARRRTAARAPRVDRGRVVPARVRPVGPRPRLRVPRGVVGSGGHDGLRRPQRALRQPPHRGQPPVLLPHAERLRPGRGVGRVDPTLDRRGGSPRHRDPRLPHGHRAPSTRSRSSGAACSRS